MGRETITAYWRGAADSNQCGLDDQEDELLSVESTNRTIPCIEWLALSQARYCIWAFYGVSNSIPSVNRAGQ